MKNEPVYPIDDLTGGVNTKQRPSKIAPNQLASIISMDFSANSLRRALGYTVFGTDVDDEETGKTLYRHSILAGVDVLIKTVGTFIKFYDRVDGAWYKTTDATFTANRRWSFDRFNGYLYGQNGVDNWVFWQGSTLTQIVNGVIAGSTVIDLPTGKGALYPASGTVMIQDEAITYTGNAADQLTGCTITATHAAGSTVILRLDSSTYSTLADANQISFFRNRIYIIDASTPTIVRHSKLADNTNPETDLVNFTISGGTAGDAGFGIAPDQIIAMKAMITGNSTSVLACFCKDGNVYAFVVTDGTGTTTNAFVPLRTMTTYPVTNRVVEVVENDLMIVDQRGHIRTLGYGDVNTPVRIETISSLIEPSLETMDFTDGAMVYDKRKKYVIGKTTDANVNDFTFYHDASYNAWGAYSHWDCVDFAHYDGELYGLSAVSGNVWKLNNGYDANGGTYYSDAVTGELTLGMPLNYKEALKLRMTGLITNNCLAYIDFFFDNEETPVTFLINGNNPAIIGASPNVAIGTVVFGSGVFGGGLPDGVSRREFYVQLKFSATFRFLKVTMRIRIDDKNVDFEMTDALLWAKLSDTNYWLPSKDLTAS